MQTRTHHRRIAHWIALFSVIWMSMMPANLGWAAPMEAMSDCEMPCCQAQEAEAEVADTCCSTAQASQREATGEHSTIDVPQNDACPNCPTPGSCSCVRLMAPLALLQLHSLEICAFNVNAELPEPSPLTDHLGETLSPPPLF